MACFQKNLLNIGNNIFHVQLNLDQTANSIHAEHIHCILIIWKFNNFSEDCLPEVYLKEAEDILFWL